MNLFVSELVLEVLLRLLYIAVTEYETCMFRTHILVI